MLMEFPGMQIRGLQVTFINKNQRVTIGNIRSSWKETNNGVPKVQFWDPWFSKLLWMKGDNIMEANPSKLQGIAFQDNKQVSDFKVSIHGHDIEYSKLITSLGICIDNTLIFDVHINDMCLNASLNECLTTMHEFTGSSQQKGDIQ